METIYDQLKEIQQNSHLQPFLPNFVLLVKGNANTGKTSLIQGIIGLDILPITPAKYPILIHIIPNPSEFFSLKHKNDVERFSNCFEVKSKLQWISDKTPEPIEEPVEVEWYLQDTFRFTCIDLPSYMALDSVIPEDLKGVVLLEVQTALQREASPGQKLFDSYGDQCIQVVTKLDWIDQNDFAGRIEQLERDYRTFYHGIINRSEIDLENQVTLYAHIQAEEQFYAAQFGNAVHGNYGLNSLRERIFQLFYTKAKRSVQHAAPILKLEQQNHQVGGKRFVEQEKAVLSDDAAFVTVVSATQSYCRQFSSLIEGRVLDLDNLSGGARLYYVFEHVYRPALHTVTSGIEDKAIETALLNSKGLQASLFAPEVAFKMLIKDNIDQLMAPSIQCVELIYEEIITFSQSIEISEFSTYSGLQTTIVKKSRKLLKKNCARAMKMVENIVEAEKSYISLKHPDLPGIDEILISAHYQLNQTEYSNVPQPKSNLPVPSKSSLTHDPAGFVDMTLDVSQSIQFDVSASQSLSSGPHANPIEVFITKKLIQVYFDLVKRTLGDLVPKAIMKFLVKDTQVALQTHLVYSLQGKVVLKETESARQERDEWQEEEVRIQTALKIIAS